MRLVDQPLQGITIAIPESRYRDEFATLFERAGARVKLCPLMTEKILEDRSSTRAFIDSAIAASFDIVIFMTGIGTKLIMSEAESLGHRDALLAALARAVVVSRGSKATAALRASDVRIDMIPQSASSEGIIELLSAVDIAGKR